MLKHNLYFIFFLLIMGSLAAQQPRGMPRIPGRNIFSGAGNRPGGDSLKRRDKFEDSITIYFRYLDSSHYYKLDSSINDFTNRFPIPATHLFLGNTGNASKPILFTPHLNPGWDPGFHAFDIYKWKLETIRFFNTTRPYTELGYTLGSRVEQIIELIHTQNIKPNWNALVQYRLINSPGHFKNQKTNHNNYLFTSWFQSKNKRYNNYFVILANQLQSGESGGIKNDQNYLADPVYKDRFNIPTVIGGDPQFGRDFFSTKITTGNRYLEFTALLRQQYDFGKKDSIVTDTTVIPLFYPRLRFEFTTQFNKYKYSFIDYVADSGYYHDFYNIVLTPGDSIQLIDRWKEVFNDFSIYQFPDAKNLQQFIKVGGSIQNLRGEFKFYNASIYNAFLHGEYRNRTKNQKWDVEAFGKLFIAGSNAGNYQAYISLQRYAGRKFGYIQLGFENVNKSPSFLLDKHSSFYLDINKNFNNENTTHIFGSFYNPALRLRLSGHYFLIGNYTYFTDYYKPQQENALFNLLRVSLEKIIQFGRHWNLYSEIYMQQKVGAVALHVPLIFTRNRLTFEGNFYKNLFLSTGFEMRYNTPYKAEDYSPVLGQFFYQDSIRIHNRPDIAAFLHFRIRSFKAYVRAENLNTVANNQGFGFTNNNFVAPGYPYPGLHFRLGIYWSFVN